jgi:mannose-6-phosphate isomerase class I
MALPEIWRKTSQHLLPREHKPLPAGQYDIYGAFPLAAEQIKLGYAALAEQISQHTLVVIDGYGGVFWQDLREQLSRELAARGIEASWIDVDDALKSSAEIEALVEPFLGGDDPIFGTRFTGELSDFFAKEQLEALVSDAPSSLTIIYGCGAALASNEGYLVYVDVPKNEIQFRSRAGSVRNLGCSEAQAPKVMYKRFYFVDWVALNRHKATLIKGIDLFVDGQRAEEPSMASGETIRAALGQMSQNFFRARPWFEPGPWGGQWIKAHMPQLAQDVPNYAWSFELISPENGLLFSSSDLLLELSFDFLMYYGHIDILGDCAERFGYAFPIRFDFLDTFSGGNLSVQCHPSPDYALKHFGEPFTQDETYYMLEAGSDATVYLGFQDDIDPQAFRAELERSFNESSEIEVERFVQKLPARKHDLFLIPHGTIHCSGINGLVLEISATPYIFTFKMYDWMRLDLEGKPRPLNIERAFDNLAFERKGGRVEQELIAHPTVTKQGEDWQIVHLPTHRDHFYDVERYEFASEIEIETKGSAHVLSLVEGSSLRIESANGMSQSFSYAETFVVPAAAGSYRLVNTSAEPIKVVCAFMKADS